MLIATIAKRFTFDAAHRLEHLPADHKCNRLHGHTYTVELEITGPVGTDGFVIDYQVLADAWAPLHELLDHRYLNEVQGLEVPSTERLAVWIAQRLMNGTEFQGTVDLHVLGVLVLPGFQRDWTLLSAVTVEESTTTWCRVCIDDLAPYGRKSLIYLM